MDAFTARIVSRGPRALLLNHQPVFSATACFRCDSSCAIRMRKRRVAQAVFAFCAPYAFPLCISVSVRFKLRQPRAQATCRRDLLSRRMLSGCGLCASLWPRSPKCKRSRVQRNVLLRNIIAPASHWKYFLSRTWFKKYRCPGETPGVFLNCCVALLDHSWLGDVGNMRPRLHSCPKNGTGI